MKMMRIFQIHVSRTTAISSASTIAKLVENVSESVNFGPTKSAARIAQQILETMQEVDENDEARIKLMKKVVDFLLLIREHFEESNAILIVSPNLSRKMRGFEDVLLEIHKDLKPTVKMGLASRIISRDRVRGELAAHSTDLDVAIEKLKLSLLLGIAVATNTTPPKSSSRRRAIPRNGERRPVKRPLCDRVFLIQADITTLKVDAVVNAAKNSLLVSFAQWMAISIALQDQAYFKNLTGKRLNGCATGDAKITNAYDLPARYVIHMVGPVYDSRRVTHKADQLASCYFKSLSLAVLHRLRRIAFPAISTGANGYPLEDAIRIALSVTRRFLLSAEGDEIDLVIFTMFSENEQIVYKRLIPEFFPSSV